MNDASLASSLLSQLQGSGLQQVAQQLNIDSSQAQSAVSAAVPLLLGALGKNAQQPDGAQALLGALQRDHSTEGTSGGFDLGGLLGNVLGGGSSAQSNGSGILGHIFGGQSAQVATNLGQATGLGGEKANQLLQVLAPIVMSFLAQRFLGNGGNADAGQLGQALGQEHQQLQASNSPLASLLDQDGDGKLGLGDVLKLGAGLFGGRS